MKNQHFSVLLGLLSSKIPKEMSLASWAALQNLPPAPDVIEFLISKMKSSLSTSLSTMTSGSWASIFNTAELFVFLNNLYCFRHALAIDASAKLKQSVLTNGGLEFLLEYAIDLIQHSKKYDMESEAYDEVLKASLCTIEELILKNNGKGDESDLKTM